MPFVFSSAGCETCLLASPMLVITWLFDYSHLIVCAWCKEKKKRFFKIQFTYRKIYHFKVYNSVGFSIFSVVYNCHHYLIPEHSFTPKRNPQTIEQSLPISNTSQPLAITNLFSISVDLPVLDISCKWRIIHVILTDIFIVV